ncbi:hypothetical protein Tco_0664816 [Tanacetum coccineum]
MSLSLAKNVIVVGADNCPPMLDKTNYSSWESRMMLYIKGKEHGKLLVDSVLNGPFKYGTIVEPGNETIPATVRARTYTDLTDEEKIRESVDIKATNIVLQDEVCLSRQRYLDQIALVANSPTYLNPTKYYLQLSSATQQYYSPPAPQRSYDPPIVQKLQYQQQVVTYSPMVRQQPYQAPALQQSYQAPAIHQPLQPLSLELDSGLVVPSFNPSDDPIAKLKKLMEFVTTAFTHCFPQTNNQLRTSSNPMNQATIQDGKVTVQTVQGRQTHGYAHNRARNTATNQGVNRQGATD